MPKRFMLTCFARAGRGAQRRPGRAEPTVRRRRPPPSAAAPRSLPCPCRCSCPAQPLSPVLQPPWPLHSFLPLQSCRAAAAAQPPLPLHEFLPAQPLSPVLQPPWPLHALWPLQTCFGALSSAANARAPPITFDPAARPAATAPIAFANSRRLMRSSSPLPATCRSRRYRHTSRAKGARDGGRKVGPKLETVFNIVRQRAAAVQSSRPSGSRSSLRRRPIGGQALFGPRPRGSIRLGP